MGGAIQTPDLLSLNRTVTFECQEVFNTPTEQVWPTKAARVASNTYESVHAYVASIPEMRESVGDRIYYGLTSRSFAVRNKHYDLGVKIPSLAMRYDSLGVFRNVPSLIAASVGTWGDKIITDMQVANGICGVDGQNFYDVDHPVNPDDPSLGVFVNTFTARPITTTNIFTGIIAMRNLKGENGVKLGLKATVLEYPSDEELNVFNAYQNAVAALTIKNQAGNENVGGVPIQNLLPLITKLQLVENPRLPSGTWYLHSTNRFAPFIFQVNEDPVVIPEFDPRDPRALNQRELAWAVDAHGAPAFALPHCSMRFVTT